MTQLLINCKWEKPWFKLRYIKSYKNSTKILINLRKIKKKKKNTHCTNLVKKSFHFHLPNSFSTNLLFTKGTNPRRRGEGGGAGCTPGSRSRVIAPDIRKETRNKRRRSGSWKREGGSGSQKARAPPIYLHRGGSKKERGGRGRTQFKCKHGRHVKVGPPLG